MPPILTPGILPCECQQPACRGHNGNTHCPRQGGFLVFSVAQGDMLGTVFCSWCLGVFCQGIRACATEEL